MSLPCETLRELLRFLPASFAAMRIYRASLSAPTIKFELGAEDATGLLRYRHRQELHNRAVCRSIAGTGECCAKRNYETAPCLSFVECSGLRFTVSVLIWHQEIAFGEDRRYQAV